MKKSRLLFVFIIVFLLTGCIQSSQNGNSWRVVKVYDGDTIKLANGEKVRYIGIDTPEMNYNNPPAEYFAEESKKFNERLVGGKIVRLEFDEEKRDKYNRLLAYVYIEETFVNAKLIEEGLAKLLTILPNIKHADEFLRLQRRAKEEKRGLWAR